MPAVRSPILAIDLDEVLGQFISSLASFHNDKYGTSLSIADFNSYRFCEVWGGTDTESIEKVHQFFDSSFFENLPLVPGAVEGVTELKTRGYSLSIVTSRQHVIEDHTRKWIARNFPGNLFDAVLFGNHWGTEGKKISKPQLCQSIGASAMIDDSLGYAQQCAQAGIPTLLFNLHDTYNWNRYKEPLHPSITPVQNWKDVLDAFPPVKGHLSNR